MKNKMALFKKGGGVKGSVSLHKKASDILYKIVLTIYLQEAICPLFP